MPAVLLVALYAQHVLKWPIPAPVERFAHAVLCGLGYWLSMDRGGRPVPSSFETVVGPTSETSEQNGKKFHQPFLSSLSVEAPEIPVAYLESGRVPESITSFMHLRADLHGEEERAIAHRWKVGVN